MVVSRSRTSALREAWTGWPAAARLLQGSFRRLLVGQFLGQAGDGLAQIAFAQLVVFEAGKGATASHIALLLAVTLLPFCVAGPVAGVVIDRRGRRRVLIVTSIVRATIALLAISTVVYRSHAGALLGVLLLLSTSRFVLAAKGAALPRTVEPDALVVANSLSGLAGMAAAFLGAVGGSTFVGHSVVAGFVAAAVLYSLAAWAFARVHGLGGQPAVNPGGPGLPPRAGLTDIRTALRVIADTRDLRGPLVAVAVHRMLLGAGFVLVVLSADSMFHLRIAGYGLALGVAGVAALGGTLAAPALARRRPPRTWLPLCFLPPAVACAIAGFSPVMTLLIASLAVTAFSFQVLKVMVDALVGRASPDALRGRIFAAYDVLYNLAFVASGLLMIPLWHAGRTRELLWLLAIGFLLVWAASTAHSRSPKRPSART